MGKADIAIQVMLMRNNDRAPVIPPPRKITRRYELSCVNCPPELVPELERMIERASPVSYRTFLLHVHRGDLRAVFPSYQWGRGTGLRMEDDYHVRYYRSEWLGKRCFYVKHSAVEYVFTEEGRGCHGSD